MIDQRIGYCPRLCRFSLKSFRPGRPLPLKFVSSLCKGYVIKDRQSSRSSDHHQRGTYRIPLRATTDAAPIFPTGNRCPCVHLPYPSKAGHMQLPDCIISIAAAQWSRHNHRTAQDRKSSPAKYNGLAISVTHTSELYSILPEH